MNVLGSAIFFGVAALLGALLVKAWDGSARAMSRKTQEIVIAIEGDLISLNARPGLLYVRDGKD